MRNVIATHARAQLLKLLDCVEAGESITILRRGRPVAVLSPSAVPAIKPIPTPPSRRARRKRVLLSEAEILAAANRPRPR